MKVNLSKLPEYIRKRADFWAKNELAAIRTVTEPELPRRRSDNTVIPKAAGI